MKFFQKSCLLLLLVFISIFIVGCWDVIELDEIFIATAIAIDASENPEEFEVTIEVAKTGNIASSSTSTEEQGSSKNTILMKEKAKTLAGAFEKLNYDSSRSIILQHCQVLLIGKQVAEENLSKFVDFFLRGRQPRLEIIMVLVDGNAGEILQIEPLQEITSSAYIMGIVKDMTRISKTYKIRVLDFINQLLSQSKSCTMPVISKESAEGQEGIKLSGKAFFEAGKLKGIKDKEEVLGFLLSKGNVKGQIFTIETQEGDVSFYIDNTKYKEKISFEDGKLKISYKFDITLIITEIIGFGEYDFIDFLEYVTESSKNQLKQEILQNFEYLKEINVDALDYFTKIYKKDPKLWDKIKEDKVQIFENAEIEVEIKANIPSAGKSAESVEMEKKRYEYR